MNIKLDDFVTIKATGASGRLIGRYLDHHGSTLVIETLDGDVNLDLPVDADWFDYLELPR